MSKGRTPSADILDLSLAELNAQLALWQEPSYRADQIWGWLYKRFAVDFDEMTNLPLTLRQRLSEFYRITPLTPVDEQISLDRLTRKVLFRLPENVPYTACALSSGLGNIGDNVHFTASAARELGKRYAKEMLTLLRH